MQYYKIGLVFGSVCVFAGILELSFIALSNLTKIPDLWDLNVIAIISFSVSSIILGSIAICKIYRKPMMSVFICGECSKQFQDKFDLRKHYSEHLMKQ